MTRVGAIAIRVGAQAPAFDVASVRISRATPPFRVGVEFLPTGQVRAENAPLMMLLQAAFDTYQIDVAASKSAAWQSLDIIDARAGTAALPVDASPRERNARLSAMLLGLMAPSYRKRGARFLERPLNDSNVSNDLPR